MKVSWEQTGGRYFLRFNHSAEAARPVYHADQIQSRLDAFLQWLDGAPTRPWLVTVCRSVHSGYTPRTEADRLERLVIHRLQELWPLQQDAFEGPTDRTLVGASRW